jgi:SAM domain (Sterile alpha motif)
MSEEIEPYKVAALGRTSPLLGAEDHRMDVVAWLRGLGLEQYAPAFRDNDIDDAVLRRLTGEDLRELGIASVGHRRRLLDAIAALGASASVADTTMNVEADLVAKREPIQVAVQQTVAHLWARNCCSAALPSATYTLTPAPRLGGLRKFAPDMHACTADVLA